MIKLDISDYCQNCPYFEPTVHSRPTTFYVNDEKNSVYLGDTIVRCESRSKCAEIRKFLETETRNAEN